MDLSLTTLFWIVAGVTLAGIGYVIFIMSRSVPTLEGAVEPIEPEEVLGVPRADEGKFDPMAGAKEVKSRGNLFAKLKIKKSSKPSLENELDGLAVGVADLPEVAVPDEAPVGLFGKIAAKFKLPTKDNPMDDIPEPTPLPSLKQHLETLQSKSHKKAEEKRANAETVERNLASNETGTAAMKTVPGNPDATDQVDVPTPRQGFDLTENNSPKLPFAQPSPSLARELEASSQLEDLRSKYAKLDAMFLEKSHELEETDKTLSHEIQNRQDFEKLRTLLEEELQNVKSRARDLQASLKAARMETEMQKSEAEELRKQIEMLEETIIGKNDQIDKAKFKSLQEGVAPEPDSSNIPSNKASGVRPKTPEEIERELGLKRPDNGASDQDVSSDIQPDV